MNVLVTMIILVVVVAVYGLLMRKYGLKGLTCTRAFSKQVVTEGDEAELVEVIGNDRMMIVPWLRVESRISRYLRLGRQENLDVSASMYHRSLFTLMPYQRITRRHKVKFLRRGVYDVGSVSITAGDVLGMFKCSRDQYMQVPVVVYPRLLDDDRLPRLLSQLTGEVTQQRQLLRDPFLFAGLKPYQPGDPVRDIHWPATARMQEPYVRVHDYTAQTRLMIVINAQLTDGQWGNIVNYEEGVIEYMISMAATLCVQALRNGMTAGFAANMPMDDTKVSAVLPPAGGAAREEELLAAFARLRIVRTLRFPSFLRTLTDLKDVDMLIISCYDSEELQQCMAELRSAGNTVNLHVLENWKEALTHE